MFSHVFSMVFSWFYHGVIIFPHFEGVPSIFKTWGYLLGGTLLESGKKTSPKTSPDQAISKGLV